MDDERLAEMTPEELYEYCQAQADYWRRRAGLARHAMQSRTSGERDTVMDEARQLPGRPEPDAFAPEPRPR
jgi:hypothetical protein